MKVVVVVVVVVVNVISFDNVILKGHVKVSASSFFSQWHDHREDLRRHDDHGLLQAEQGQEAAAATGGTGSFLFSIFTL